MDPKQKDKLVELMEWYIDSLDKFNKKDWLYENLYIFKKIKSRQR
jgi:hypothetical protein